MRPGRAKYDAAFLQCFCHVFAHIIKCFELQRRKCFKYLHCDVKMTSARGPFASFCFFHLELWPPEQQKPRTLHVAQSLSAQAPVAMAFHGSFYHSFYPDCSLEIGEETLHYKCHFIFLFLSELILIKSFLKT